MPSSAYQTINIMVEEILKTQPKTILDIGIGFGKWGFLCREYLESWKDRVFPKQWQIQIDGIEIFKNYVDDLIWNKVMYNKIFIGNAFEIINEVTFYDLIIAGDVIEHLPKDQGRDLITKCIKKSRCFILSVPLGQEWLHNVVVADNPSEKHQAAWQIEDIAAIQKTVTEGYTMITRLWKNKRGTGCIAIWRKK